MVVGYVCYCLGCPSVIMVVVCVCYCLGFLVLLQLSKPVVFLALRCFCSSFFSGGDNLLLSGFGLQWSLYFYDHPKKHRDGF